ncbi:MAG TPA: flagellar motor protein MotD [Rudaea sp.]|jgi:chemotaxis protein MotB|nr:flagellar motor protein MotD [Rudaea sp.]
MARKHAHEDHVNHEAWAIPYGDLVTLLLAFFVVMYAVSSINEGKYRVLADSLAEAFGGKPRSIQPVQTGKFEQRGSAADRAQVVAQKLPRGMLASNVLRDLPNTPRMNLPKSQFAQIEQSQLNRAAERLERIAVRIEDALKPLIDSQLVTVQHRELWVEVEIKADILFTSGDARPRPEASETIQQLAEVLRDVPNAVRVEGYTDNQPISTPQFPSNWELSAARAASVVHVFAAHGVDEDRLTIIGYGEKHARTSNDTAEGRNANRRVVLVILAAPDQSAPPAEPSNSASINSPSRRVAAN